MFFGTSVFLTGGSRLSAETREIFDPGESFDYIREPGPLHWIQIVPKRLADEIRNSRYQ